MSFLDTVKARIGNDVYLRLEEEAEKEVAVAKGMPLRGAHNEKKYYQPRHLLPTLLGECKLFQDKGLLILPNEVVTILFRCKLLAACGTRQEYDQLSGGNGWLNVQWSQKGQDLQTLIQQSFERLQSDIRDRELITRLTSYVSSPPVDSGSVQSFFDYLFKSLGAALEAFVADERLASAFLEPGKHDLTEATEFFQAPSIGYRCKGSREYCRWISTHWLRTFLNLLRVGSFVHPGQIVFAESAVKIEAPRGPVFLGDYATGCFLWDQDTKESWAKIPDGALFLSFGYRHLASIWLDKRTFPLLTQFVVDHKKIFDCLKNPWSEINTGGVAPTLDLLSSAVQIPDLGAKVLLIYTCLEHLFVPEGTKSNQKLYIIGGLKALKPSLLPWFDELYRLRCDYAHRGFVIRNERTIGLVKDSAKNAMVLLTAKLSVA